MIDSCVSRLARRHIVLALALLAPAATLKAQAVAPASGARGLSLQEALALAEGESETVGIARADVARAQGERKRAKSGYFPQLNGLASYQRTLQSQFSALEDDAGEPAGPPAPECARFVPQPGLSSGTAARFPRGRGGVLEQRRSVRPVQRAAVRTGEHLPLWPLLQPDALHGREAERSVSVGERRCQERGVRV